jgi:hypothetical protein
MSVTDRYGIYGVHLNATLCAGVTQVDDEYESTVRGEALSGEPSPRFQSLVAQLGRASFSSVALKTLLDTITTTDGGLVRKYSSMAAAVWASGLRIYWQKWASGGIRAAGSVHIQDKVSAGLVHLRRITCEHQGDAVGEVAVEAGYDGSADLIARTYNVALPAGGADDQRFTLGPITLGNIVFTHFKGLEIDFGFAVDREGSESEVQDRYVTIRTVNPVITLRGIDLGWYAAAKIPTATIAATQANTKIYLRKRAAGGSFVADGTAEHILINAAGQLKVGKIGGAGGHEPSEIVAMLQCKFDASNPELTFNTATAIV